MLGTRTIIYILIIMCGVIWIQFNVEAKGITDMLKMMDPHELPNDIAELKEIIQDQKDTLRDYNKEIQYAHQYMLASNDSLTNVPGDLRKEVFDTMKRMDEMTDQQFKALNPKVQVNKTYLTYFPRQSATEGADVVGAHPLFVLDRYDDTISGIPLSKLKKFSSDHTSITLKLRNNAVKYFFLKSILIDIDYRRVLMDKPYDVSREEDRRVLNKAIDKYRNHVISAMTVLSLKN